VRAWSHTGLAEMVRDPTARGSSAKNRFSQAQYAVTDAVADMLHSASGLAEAQPLLRGRGMPPDRGRLLDSNAHHDEPGPMPYEPQTET